MKRDSYHTSSDNIFEFQDQSNGKILAECRRKKAPEAPWKRSAAWLARGTAPKAMREKQL